jgi:hypothetical protein
MTPDEFAQKMRAISEAMERGRNDPESRHCYADDLMCELLKELGYEEGVKVFEEMDKWYA